MKPHLLIVDDDPELQDLFLMILGRNFDIRQAACGEQAVAFALDSLPDLILLDVMLPDIDGLEVCRQLNANNRTSSVPIVLITAKANILSLVAEQKLVVADVVRKPFVPRELLQRINKILERTGTGYEPTKLQPIPAPA